MEHEVLVKTPFKKNKKFLAIAIPFNGEVSVLKRHLAFLNRQKTEYVKYVILIIEAGLKKETLGECLKIMEKFENKAIILKNGEKSGPSGSFFIAENFVKKQQAFEAFAYADVECYSEDEEFLSKLLDAAQSHVWVCPRLCTIYNGEIAYCENKPVLNYYHLLNKKVFKNFPVHDPSIFIGGEDTDAEYFLRNVLGIGPYCVKNTTVYHPLKTNDVFTPIAYFINEISRGVGFHEIIRFILLATYFSSLVLFSKVGKEILNSALRHFDKKEGKTLFKEFMKVRRMTEVKNWRLSTPITINIEAKEKNYLLRGAITFFANLKFAVHNFRKNILIKEFQSYLLIVPYILFAKSVGAEKDGMIYEITYNSNVATHILKIVLFPISVLFFTTYLFLWNLKERIKRILKHKYL